MRDLISKLVIFVVLMSLAAILRAEPVMCNDKEIIKRGNPDKFEFKESLSFEAAIKSQLQEWINETDRVMNLSDKYRGPDKEYIPRLIELFGQPIQGKGFSCLWAHNEKGSILKKFTEKGPNTHRQGIALLKNGSVVAFLYTLVVEV